MNYLLLIRPFNLIFVLISVYAGAIYMGSIFFSLPILFAMLSAFCIAAAGYAINDFFDVEIDRINKPDRILAAAKITPENAYRFAVFLFVIGIVFSFFTSKWLNVFIAIINSFLLFFYAKNFKLEFVIGNFIVALTTASTFIFGGISNDNFHPSLMIAVFAFFYTFIREIVKDMEDHKADQIKKANTIPIKIGTKRAVTVILFTLVCMFLYSLELFAFSKISSTTFFLLFFLVFIPLVVSIFFLYRTQKLSDFKKNSSFMKIDMFTLLLILLLGK